jgi:FAD:protein FMN transferase
MTASDGSARFQALGTTAHVVVTNPASLPVSLDAVRATIEEFDLACSRFRDDSELVALNASAGATVTVSPLLCDAVQAGLRAALLTDGDVDPTIGAALIALGYDRDFDALDQDPPTHQISIASVAGWRTVALDREARTVRVPRGVTLDLGATAKALCADRAAARAVDAAGCGVLVSLGGDMSFAGDPPDGGWRVRVTDDHAAGPEAPGQSITLRSGGLATSSTTVRRWRTASGDAHHLLDPGTGRPVDGAWRTVSVSAASCLDANIASTAAIVRGERALAWLESLGLPSRLVGVDGAARHVAGWPTAGDDLAPSDRTPVEVAR